MYKDFEAAEAAYYGYWYADDPDREKALKIAEYCFEHFKEHEDQILMDLIVFYGTLGRVEDAKKMLRLGFEKGNWYPKEYFAAFWNDAGYEEEREIWDEMRITSALDSTVIYKVKEPSHFKIDHAYPVFISLHGWGEDLTLFERFWDSEQLQKNYLHVLIQSSQMVGYSQYVWNDREMAIHEIKGVLESVKKRYKVSDELLVGGFSQGATLAVDIAFSMDELNVSGFIALNPNQPESLKKEVVEKRNKKLKGCILTGDQDQSFEDQKKMCALFEACHFKHRLLVKENFGHWFPEDLSQRIDQSIAFLKE